MAKEYKTKFTEDDLHRFEKGWLDFMIDIWRDKQMQLNIKDTLALSHSMKGSITYEPSTVITHKFMEYGLYVAAGVGKGYVHGNGGSLSFLEGKHAEYYFGENAEEKEVGLGLSQHAMFNHRHNSRGAALTSGKHRQRRDWFSKKYLYSIYRLNEKESEYYGRKYWGLLSATLDAMFDKNSKLRSL